MILFLNVQSEIKNFGDNKKYPFVGIFSFRALLSYSLDHAEIDFGYHRISFPGFIIYHGSINYKTDKPFRLALHWNIRKA